ncbi:glycosyltransferase [Subsaxibacter sp. CAU 1640]|uniref:glycosyltransferase n=1 Tax=Subsaxibacter sp. CAU 1640 TaxID=2933271 RepID=UPI002003A155|nr:glycosyltransferase [Subsaxibacter sp. CAU 1640]MCK7591033.1 glycosyltransferase [Subsaxibacter sp. CAU 1640]
MTNKPKISILTIDFGMGGAQRFISLLLPQLVQDFQVSLVLFVDYIHFEIPEEVELVILNPDSKSSNSYISKIQRTFGLFSKYKNFVRKNKIEVSLSLLPVPNIINSLLTISNKRVKTIISERCYSSEMYKDNGVQMLLAKICFPVLYHRNNLLFSNSIHINEDLKQNFGVKMPMKVVYNPIEVNDKVKLRTEARPNANALKIINSGRIYEAKNQKLIVEAMNMSEKGGYYLTVLGDGILQEELQKNIQNSGLNDFVDLKGKVSGVKTYLIENDCFILSSNNEGFPNALLEALSVGLPCISTNCLSGPLEMLNDNEPVNISAGEFHEAKYGILVNVNDAIGLNKAMEYLKNEPEMRQKYSRLAFERAKMYSLDNIYNEIKELIIN